MTIKELIAELNDVENKDSMCIVSGYEGGYQEVTTVQSKDIKLNVHKEWWYGNHDDCNDGQQPDATGTLIG